MSNKQLKDPIETILEASPEIAEALEGVHKEIFNTVKNAGKEDTKEVPS